MAVVLNLIDSALSKILTGHSIALTVLERWLRPRGRSWELLSQPIVAKRNTSLLLAVTAPSVLAQGYVYRTSKPVFISDLERSNPDPQCLIKFDPDSRFHYGLTRPTLRMKKKKVAKYVER